MNTLCFALKASDDEICLVVGHREYKVNLECGNCPKQTKELISLTLEALYKIYVSGGDDAWFGS
ncbi:hypothetical protein Scep_012545 [Stephania cephalantha]|uniref:Uncharacterized protein n=1 Tax=Stephania cephalantha TaxID=152367 RepID=A0AAP0JFR3_9MAGN